MQYTILNFISVATLRDLVSQIRGIGRQVDPVFVAIGEDLERALKSLNGFGKEFIALSNNLSSDNKNNIAADLKEIAQKSMELISEVDNDGSLLETVLETIKKIHQPLSALKQVGVEISALSTNAKILSAQVNVEGVDFSVFTKEIGRLGVMEAAAVQKTEASLNIVHAAAASVQEARTSFGQNNVRGLTQAAQRLENCVSTMLKQQSASYSAIDRMSEMSAKIEKRVSQCVAALQINDMTSQVVNHVANVLENLCTLLEGGAGNKEEFLWAVDFDERHLAALVRYVCKIQLEQFSHAINSFYSEIEKLKSSLVAMSVDVQGILGISVSVFQGESKDNFIRDVQSHAENAAQLLAEYARAKQQICTLMEKVSSGFNDVRDDVHRIRSIDADLRVMGLNATFKCGRLGTAGRALGIVAQELRACSRKTEESSIAVTEAISPVLGIVGSLVQRANEEDGHALALTSQTETAVRELTLMSEELEGALGGLTNGFSQLSMMMDQTGLSINIHNNMKSLITPIMEKISDIVSKLPENSELPPLIKNDIHKLLADHYTMAGERVIHDMFDTGPINLQEVSVTNSSEQSIDDMFF